MTSATEVDGIAPIDCHQPACNVVIVTYNSEKHLPRLLSDLQREAESVRMRIVVVDNGSSDQSVDIARTVGVHVVETGANLGYSGGLNAAAEHTTSDHPVLVLNPDLSIEPGSVARLLITLGSDPSAGIAVPAILDHDGSIFTSLRNEPTLGRALADALLGRRAAWLGVGRSEMVWDPSTYKRLGNPDWATGAALLISAECARRVGNWDADRFFLYSEETDFFRRAREAGMRALFVPDARARHDGGGSGSSPSLVALMAVNRIRYYRKYHRSLPSAVFHAVVALNELLRVRNPGHRAAFVAVIRPRSWSRLPGGFRP